MPRSLSGVALWLAVAWPFLVSAAWAPVPLEDLVGAADLVAVVRVIQVDDSPAPNAATATLELVEVLKSPTRFLDRTVVVQFASGLVPDRSSTFVLSGPVINFRLDERAIVFLKAKPDGRFFETIRGPFGKRRITQQQVEFELVDLETFLAEIRAHLIEDR